MQFQIKPIVTVGNQEFEVYCERELTNFVEGKDVEVLLAHPNGFVILNGIVSYVGYSLGAVEPLKVLFQTSKNQHIKETVEDEELRNQLEIFFENEGWSQFVGVGNNSSIENGALFVIKH